ncbi:hypothetical protein [Rickettsia endosymbiont of Polydrusus tereticollis]|uniref:hypothetical protein n=1 Tax=Rickettsia endosymbiont of Polydrusus tereticollis TaxID=3066251 RepID=UPI003133480F
MPTDLNVRFNKDKAFLIEQTKEFLKDKSRFSEPLTATREDVAKAVGEGNFTEALQNLEILREKQAGITLIKIEGKDGNSPMIIRDGRENPNDSRILGTEGFEMQYLNAIRAGIDIAKIEGKPELEEQLKNEAVTFIENFNKKNKNNSQEEISVNVKNKINDIAIVLETNGIKQVHKKLNVAKDFQNLNDEHCNIVTVSNIKDSQGKEHAVIEAEVALKGLTNEQKAEYEKIKTTNKPKWFTKMDNWEGKLVEQYAPKITAGNHVISTQLRQIVGMKNAFEKITAIANDNGELDVIHTSKHAGTLASISHDKNSRQEITNLNAKQAQEWMGKDHILHTNTLNSGPANIPFPSVQIDIDIVKNTNLAMQAVGGKNTNTAFNKFRKIAAFNNFNGVKDQLKDIANNLPKEGNFESIATHLKPRGRLERFFGINKPVGDLTGLLDIAKKTHNLSPETHKILEDAANLKKDIEKADVVFARGADKENISVDISRKLNYLSHQISNSEDFVFRKVPKYEILTMCASGKDRTGLAEHDQSSSAVAAKLGIQVTEVDKQLLKTGHTAGQAGGVYAGGATVGCYGTLQVTGEGFPASRKESLQSIIEVTGANNKIKKLKKGEIINEKEEQKKATEIPNMYRDEGYTTSAKQPALATSIAQSNKQAPVAPEVSQSQQQTRKSNKEIEKIDKPIPTPTRKDEIQKKRKKGRQMKQFTKY